MRWTSTLIPTLREDPQDAEIISHKLLVRGAFIRKLTAGAYSYLPLGMRVMGKVQTIIREEMRAAGAEEVLLPALHPLELWKETGRDKTLADVMIKFKDRHGKVMCLGPTHEEVITSLVAGNVSSYKHLPLILFQIQTKFRDEIRPRFGVIRSCEFIMKDAYSFDRDVQGLEESYKKMYDAYCRIFSRCGLPYVAVQADPGAMGGGESHEFMVPTEEGEDLVGLCPGCGYNASKDILTEGGKTELKEGQPCPKCGKTLDLKHTIEIGHTFKLGTKYSAPLKANYLTASGDMKEIIMGCYGIGVNRILAALIETSNDKDGIIWPASISPYEICVMPLNMSSAPVKETAEKIYRDLIVKGADVILDDRDDRAGVKFKDADLIGFPSQVIIGEKNLKNGSVEVKDRKTLGTQVVSVEKVVEYLSDLFKKGL